MQSCIQGPIIYFLGSIADKTMPVFDPPHIESIMNFVQNGAAMLFPFKLGEAAGMMKTLNNIRVDCI